MEKSIEVLIGDGAETMLFTRRQVKWLLLATNLIFWDKGTKSFSVYAKVRPFHLLDYLKAVGIDDWNLS